MQSKILIPLVAALGLFLLGPWTQTSQAAGPVAVTVRLDTGRKIEAQIDPRTGIDRLWITTTVGRGAISQAIAWDQIARIEIDGKSYDSSVVRTAVATVLERSSGHTAQPEPVSKLLIDRTSLRKAVPRQPVSRTQPPTRVTAMDVSAALGNWDADLPFDGVLLSVSPRDRLDSLAPCDGTLDIVLRTWKDSGRSGRVELRSQRWTKKIHAIDFESGYATFQLPFQEVQPQQSSAWWSYGVLQVRLSVPGSGVIERTVSDLRLRPFEPMRDALEQHTGSRFFPGENVQRHAWVPSRH